MHEVKRVVKQADRVSKLEKCRERALIPTPLDTF